MSAHAEVPPRTKERLKCDQPDPGGAVFALERAPLIISRIPFNHIQIKRVTRQYSRVTPLATDVCWSNKKRLLFLPV